MPKRTVKDIEELQSLVGTEVAVSDWFEVSQERIDQFAEATGDHQWIHVDPERAKRESPFGGTIAHGYLTLSLLPHLNSEAFGLEQKFKMGINYGLNKLRFIHPVPAGSRIRNRMKLLSVSEVKGGWQVNWTITVEIDGIDKPACVAEVIFRMYDGAP